MMAQSRLSVNSPTNSDWQLSSQNGNRFSPVAPPEELFHEIEVLHDELERSNEQLRTTTSELEKLRKQVKEQEDGGAPSWTQGPKRFDADGATESEVRWVRFVTEKSQLQSEKGWRRALKESKKILQERLDESRAQKRARDRELANLRNRLGDDAHEVQKERTIANDLRERLAEAKATLESERQLLVQEREKNWELEEEFAVLHHTKESNKLAYGAAKHNERSERRLLTNDLASQLTLDDDDFGEYDQHQHQSPTSAECDGLELIHEEEEEEEVCDPSPWVRTGLQQQEEQLHDARQSVRTSIQQQQQNHARQSARRSIFLQREEELHRRLSASEAARRELEAQVVELQCRPQSVEHTVLAAPATPLPKVPDPEPNGSGNELWEECEELRNELAKVSQAKHEANWEAKDYQRRLQASEALCQELQARVSDMDHRSQLAEKQFRDWQQQTHEPWWYKLASCHCLQKNREQTNAIAAQAATPAKEEQLQLSRKPRAAQHMTAAKNSGAAWLTKPLG